MMIVHQTSQEKVNRKTVIFKCINIVWSAPWLVIEVVIPTQTKSVCPPMKFAFYKHAKA